MKNFEKFKKIFGGVLKPGEITISKSGIYFNNYFSSYFPNYVEIYLNRKDNLILFTNGKSKLTGFVKQSRHSLMNNFTIKPKNLIDLVKLGKYKSELTDEGIIIKGALK